MDANHIQFVRRKRYERRDSADNTYGPSGNHCPCGSSDRRGRTREHGTHAGTWQPAQPCELYLPFEPFWFHSMWRRYCFYTCFPMLEETRLGAVLIAQSHQRNRCFLLAPLPLFSWTRCFKLLSLLNVNQIDRRK